MSLSPRRALLLFGSLAALMASGDAFQHSTVLRRAAGGRHQQSWVAGARAVHRRPAAATAGTTALRCSLDAFDAGALSSLLTGASDSWDSIGSAFLVASSAADYEFQGSYASLYTTLFLFVISFPGIISLVTRATKVSLDQRTYVLPGPAVEGAKELRQVAAELMAYFQANNYKVAEAGETIIFKGAIEKSKSQAFFLSACMFGGLWTLALVLSIGVPKIGPLEVDKLWFLLTLPSPYAGWYYWQNAQVDGEIRVRLLTTDNEEQTEVTVQAGKEQLDQFAAVMDYNEKGKIRVRGILENTAA